MWHHKAQEEIASRFMECNVSLQRGAPIETVTFPRAAEQSQLLAG
jgi:hypothetical protein